METKCNEYLTLLFVPNDGLENITSLQVLANQLRGRGHKTIFALNMAINDMIDSKDEFKDLDQMVTQTKTSLNNALDFEYEVVFQLTAIEIFEKFSLKYLWKILAQNKERDYYFCKLIERLRPDILIIESLLCCPALTNSHIPWVSLNFGASNQFLKDDRLPPAWSGMSFLSQSFDKQKWNHFKDEKNQIIDEFCQHLNDWCISRGAPKLANNSLNKPSPYLNVYVYPEELDFNLGKSFPPKDWYRVSCLISEDNDLVPLEIPSDLMCLPGQLIYFEINCCANNDLNLMKRLIQLLSVSPNKFIVSKGPLHNRYDLPHNMWGLQSLPQKQAIKASQLVITCGNTNTIIEALFYGKPMIVMPLFGHQLDNAQRIKDHGLGVILQPYKCQISTTLGSINAMLFDPLVHRRLHNISYKMQNSEQGKTLCALIETLNNK